LKRTLVLLGFLLLSFAARAHELTTPTIAPANDVHSAAIASNGSGFLTVFARNGRTYTVPAGPDGRPAALPTLLSDEIRPIELAAIGSDYAGVWFSSSGLGFVRLGPDGRVVRERRLPLALFPLSLASNGRTLLLTGVDSSTRRLLGYFLSADGDIVKELGPIGLETNVTVAATAGGETFYVAAGHPSGMRVYKISADGAIDAVYMDPFGRPISIAARSNGFRDSFESQLRRFR
jgi:hypothetical protein